MRKTLILIISLFAALSCSDSGDDHDFERFRIASEKTFMELSNGEWGDGYVVAFRSDYNVWSYFPYEIEGLNYVKGNEYLVHLKVEKVKDADGNIQKKYYLRRLVDSYKADSQKLPTSTRGRFIIGSELRINPKNTKVHNYAVKFLDEGDGDETEIAGENGDNGGTGGDNDKEDDKEEENNDGGDKWKDWEFLEVPRMLYEGFEEGYEYEAEFLRSNVSKQNVTVDPAGNETYKEFYRIIRIIRVEEKESENLPGQPIPSSDKPK